MCLVLIIPLLGYFFNMQLVQFILAVLDVTVSEGHDPELLETDKEGNKSTESGKPSCYDLIAEKRLIVSTQVYALLTTLCQ